MSKQDVYQVDTYKADKAAKAGEFGVGASDLTEINKATEARRNLTFQRK